MIKYRLAPHFTACQALYFCGRANNAENALMPLSCSKQLTSSFGDNGTVTFICNCPFSTAGLIFSLLFHVVVGRSKIGKPFGCHFLLRWYIFISLHFPASGSMDAFSTCSQCRPRRSSISALGIALKLTASTTRKNSRRQFTP